MKKKFPKGDKHLFIATLYHSVALQTFLWGIDERRGGGGGGDPETNAGSHFQMENKTNVFLIFRSFVIKEVGGKSSTQ